MKKTSAELHSERLDVYFQHESEKEVAAALRPRKGRRSGGWPFRSLEFDSLGRGDAILGQRPTLDGRLQDNSERVEIKAPTNLFGLSARLASLRHQGATSVLFDLRPGNLRPYDLRLALYGEVRAGRAVPSKVRAVFYDSKGQVDMLLLTRDDLLIFGKHAGQEVEFIPPFDEERGYAEDEAARQLREERRIKTEARMLRAEKREAERLAYERSLEPNGWPELA